MRARRALQVALVLLAAGAGLALARPGPIVSTDQEQPRLNVAAPIPRPGAPIGQSFVAAHDGLSAVEALAAVFDDPAAGPAELTLRLRDSQGGEIAAARYPSVAHNAPLRLTFPPQPHSAGRQYTLIIDGAAGQGNATAWAYSLDGYARGTLLAGGVPAAGDLRFTTSYTVQWPSLLRTLAAELRQLARLALPLWLVLFAPGLLLLEWVPGSPARWARVGLALGLSLALLALLWLWATTFDLALSARAVTIGYGVAGVGWLVAFGRRAWVRRASFTWPSGHDAMMAAVLLLTLASRLFAVRDLAFPPWVDSPHHLLIARLLAESGRLPTSYAPVLPVESFTYHFGFHALAVTFHWLSGLALPEVFLPLGQALNALAALAAYTLAAGLSGRPRAGLVAAFFVGCVSFFPGYYLAWGRYTQLTGLLILGPALALVWPAFTGTPGGLGARVRLVVLAVLAAGLFLTHYRLVVFFVLFCVVALATNWRSRAGWLALGAAGGLAFGLTLPWLIRLALLYGPRLAVAPGRLAAANSYNVFPVEYFASGLERAWGVVAVLALAWGAIRRERVMLVIVAWVALTFGLLNLGPGTWLVNNNSWAITLFLPGAAAIGWACDRLWSLPIGDLRIEIGIWDFGAAAKGLEVLLPAVMAGSVAFAGVRGLREQLDIVRPVTILATADDVAAVNWVRDNTPQDAVFLVNSWAWLPRTWASPDAGAWLWPLADRRTTLPPVDYAFQPGWLQEVNEYNQAVSEVFAVGVDTPEALALLRQGGVTHVFIGARGGVLKPEAFAASPAYRLLFTNGAAWVFEVSAR